MIFEYQALDKQGDKITDVIDAPTEISARQKLRSRELYVVRINHHDAVIKEVEGHGKKTLAGLYERLNQYVGLKLSSKQVGIFSRQLSTLLGAGMPLLVAITDIIEQIDNKNFKKIVVDIKEKLAEGSSLSNCLSRHQIIFSDMYINMVRVGENLGSLDQVIERLADLEEKKNQLKGKIQAALYYPIFLAFFSSCMIIFLLLSVIPSLERMFLEMEKDLPLPTEIVIGISNLLSSPLFMIPFILVVSSAVYLFYKYSKTPEGKYKIDEWKLKLPLISNLYKKLIILRFTQNLGILLNNKVDILRSFEIVKAIVGNVIIEEQIEEISKKVREGSPVSKALSKSIFLPKLVLGMISAGEASDKLDGMLLKIGDVYDREIDMAVSGLTSILEPVMIAVMAIAIGMIVVSVLLPIFEMNMLI